MASSSPSCILPSEHDPRRWSKQRRWVMALIIFNLIVPLDLSTTFFSGVQQQIQDHFGASNALATLDVGLYNLGAVFGVLVGGPISELYGRRPIYIVSSIGFVIFTLGSAFSPTITCLLICRGLAGLFASPPFAIYGGSMADMFSPDERGPVMALFTLALQGAPTIGPVPSSFLGSFLPWRWPLALVAIWGALIGSLMFLVPETEPVAIERKLSKSRGVVHDKEVMDQSNMWSKALLRPMIMLCKERIILWTALYHSFVYGLLFILLEAYPHIYDTHYSMTREEATLAFISPFIGNVLGVLIYFGSLKPQYETHQHKIRLESGGKREIEPEARLPGVLIASVLTPLGLFWFTLAADPQVHFFVSMLSGIPIGIGMTLLHLSLYNYYIDLYPTRSASAIAANCALRNLVVTVLPSVGLPLYSTLGIRNANILLASISCLGLPTGIVLYVFGRRLRMASRWAKQTGINDEGSRPSFNTQVTPLLAHVPENTYGGTGYSS
ncbi:hypothetical protein ID866_7264 [Astraeus odoratus]|nr:hypothetical protein ID866_7264 [Astraeus odoratus]